MSELFYVAPAAVTVARVMVLVRLHRETSLVECVFGGLNEPVDGVSREAEKSRSRVSGERLRGC